jgi:putative salt-induced outer membrane protein
MKTTSLAPPLLALFAALAPATVSRPAAAEPLPAGSGGGKAATTGSTDVVGGDKFEAATKKPDEKASKNATEAQILGGGLLSTGNSRFLAATGSGQFRMRRAANQVSVAAAANYARSAPDAKSAVTPTVENYQAKIRYDRFVASEFALFLALTGRRDRFQELDLRLNIDPGAAYYFVDEPSQQLWGELGYDFQFDLRRQDAITAAELLCTTDPACPAVPEKTKARHSARLFTGYDNALNAAVAFRTGLEYLQGVAPDTTSWRLNWDVGLTSKIGGNFSLATTFTLKYDHNPLGPVKNTDTMTAVSLVYQLL